MPSFTHVCLTDQHSWWFAHSLREDKYVIFEATYYITCRILAVIIWLHMYKSGMEMNGQNLGKEQVLCTATV